MEESCWMQKPVIVRVTRNVTQSLLDAFLLEIYKREGPYKEVVLVRHLETVTDSQTTVAIINSVLVHSDHHKPKFAFKKDNMVTENARFEQMPQFGNGNKEVYDKFRYYEVFRVESPIKSIISSRSLSPEEKMMANYLPLLRKYVPKAAHEIEGDCNIHSTSDDSKEDQCVYDYYVEDEMDISMFKNRFTLVRVVDENEDLYRSFDSNARDYSINSFLGHEESGFTDESEDEDEASERRVRRTVFVEDGLDCCLEDRESFVEFIHG